LTAGGLYARIYHAQQQVAHGDISEVQV
jgi:hypothetical protein